MQKNLDEKFWAPRIYCLQEIGSLSLCVHFFLSSNSSTLGCENVKDKFAIRSATFKTIHSTESHPVFLKPMYNNLFHETRRTSSLCCMNSKFLLRFIVSLQVWRPKKQKIHARLWTRICIKYCTQKVEHQFNFFLFSIDFRQNIYIDQLEH